jgi:hypothetical protein
MVCAGEIAAGTGDEQRERAEEIRTAAERGAELIRGLIAGGRAPADVPSPTVDPAPVITGARRMLERKRGAGHPRSND